MNVEQARIAAIIASTGRALVLRETVESILAQTLRPERLVIAVIKEADCDILAGEFAGVEVIIARKGLSAQLNDAVGLLDIDIDYVCFFDDDVVLVSDYIQNMVRFLQTRNDVVALSGHAFCDGNITGEKARALVAKPPAIDPIFRNTGKHWVLYGCNMVIRRGVLAREKFDERFVLYAWMFEVEITYRLLAYGKVGRYSGGRLVHLKVQAGRISGVRYGYSEVVNRVYLALRPALASRRPYIVTWAIYNSVKALVLNSLYSITHRNDPCIDYAGRVRGNLKAFGDLLLFKVMPEQIHNLK
jgi:GT2 family glycosyltransferase